MMCSCATFLTPRSEGQIVVLIDAAIAGGPPLAYVHLQQGTLNVNFIGTDGHIHALWREVGTPWNYANQQDLTLATGAPPALTQPVGLSFGTLRSTCFTSRRPTAISP
jgi:hypothetical protein